MHIYAMCMWWTIINFLLCIQHLGPSSILFTTVWQNIYLLHSFYFKILRALAFLFSQQNIGCFKISRCNVHFFPIIYIFICSWEIKTILVEYLITLSFTVFNVALHSGNSRKYFHRNINKVVENSIKICKTINKW